MPKVKLTPDYTKEFNTWVREMMARYDSDLCEIGEVIGKDKSGVCRRLKGKTPWTFVEVYTLCRFFRESFVFRV